MKTASSFLKWLQNAMRVYLTGWRLTFRLRGRTSRREFWIFYLVHSLLLGFLVVADSLHSYAVPYLSVIFSYASLVTIVSIGVRRLHDIDVSGKWMWLMLLPLGGVLLVVPHVRKGTSGPNRFGEPVNATFEDEDPGIEESCGFYKKM